MSSPTLEDRLRLLDDLEPIRRRASGTVAPPRRSRRRELLGVAALALVLFAGILAILVRSPDRNATDTRPAPTTNSAAPLPPDTTTPAVTIDPKDDPATAFARAFPSLPPGKPFDDPHFVRFFKRFHKGITDAEWNAGVTEFALATIDDTRYSAIVFGSGHVCLVGLIPKRTRYITQPCRYIGEMLDPRRTTVGGAGTLDGEILYMLAVPGIRSVTLNPVFSRPPVAARVVGTMLYARIYNQIADSYTVTLDDGSTYTHSNSDEP